MQMTAMMEQIESIPAMMEAMGGSARFAAQKAAGEMDILSLNRIVLTGCGDSIGAAMAAKQLFLRCAGLPVQVETAIDLSRHWPGTQLAQPGTLVVLVSKSGNVSRIIELARRIRQLGGLALAVTANDQSRLYREAGAALKLDIPDFHRSGPGLRSYGACLLGLCELAVELGLARGTLSEACGQDIRREMDTLPGKIREALPGWETDAKAAAQQLADCACHEFIGDGPDYATAWFGLGKELEVAGLPGCAINTEDWLHMHYFVRDVHATAAHIVANRCSPAAGRSRELLQIATEMERPVVCVTDSGEIAAGLPSQRLTVLTTTPLKYGELHPLVQYLPLSKVMARLGVGREETDFRGTADHWTACVDFASIGASEERIVE